MKSLVISFPFCMSSFIFLRPAKVPISVAPFPEPEPRATDPIMGGFHQQELNHLSCRTPTATLTGEYMLALILKTF